MDQNAQQNLLNGFMSLRRTGGGNGGNAMMSAFGGLKLNPDTGQWGVDDTQNDSPMGLVGANSGWLQMNPQALQQY